MKIDDLTQLLDNRLREFKLSRDYAKMSGNLERMNTADKEIIALEDTIYQLNLLVDTSKSAAVKEVTLTEAITDGSIAVLGEYDITPYATDPLHERKIMDILSKMGVMDTVEKIDKYIKSKALSSPVTGEMVMSASLAYSVDTRLMMAIMQQDSSFGTQGLAVRTLNPGNVGNDDDGNIRTYESWQEGVTAVAEWLNRHRGSTPIPETPLETTTEPVATTTPTTASSTPTTSTTTPTTSTSTPTTSTTTPTTASSTATTSPSTSSGQATTTPTTSTTTPTTSTTTPTTSSTTPSTSTTTPATTSPTSSSGDSSGSTATTSPSTTTEETATSTSSQPSPEATAGTAGQATTTQETTN